MAERSFALTVISLLAFANATSIRLLLKRPVSIHVLGEVFYSKGFFLPLESKKQKQNQPEPLWPKIMAIYYNSHEEDELFYSFIVFISAFLLFFIILELIEKCIKKEANEESRMILSFFFLISFLTRRYSSDESYSICEWINSKTKIATLEYTFRTK